MNWWNYRKRCQMMSRQMLGDQKAFSISHFKFLICHLIAAYSIGQRSFGDALKWQMRNLK